MTKIPRAEFEAAIHALLSTPATPASAIADKRQREAGAQKPGPKKKRD